MFSRPKKRAQRQSYPSAGRQLFGILLSCGVLACYHIAYLTTHKDHNPALPVLLVEMIVAYVCGLRAGVIATALAFAYYIVHYSRPGKVFTYDQNIWTAIVLSAVVYLAFVYFAGFVAGRARNAAIREFDASAAKEAETEQRIKSEDELRTSEDKWRLIVDSAMDAVIVMGEDGKISLWSRSAESLFGWRVDEVIGQDLSETIIPERYRAAHKAGLKRFLETGQWQLTGKRLELFGLAKDGTEFPIELSVVPHWTEAGTLFIGYVRDMSVTSKLSERLRQAQKMEAIGTLAAGIAHDFNNILASISGNLLIAREELAPGNLAEGSHAEIEKAVTRASSVVRQILNFSSETASSPRSIDLSHSVQEAINLLRATIPTTVDIDAKFDPDVPPIQADTTDIHQIVLNLGINAHHAIRDENGKLEIHVARVDLNETEAAALVNLSAGVHARLTVRDTGKGMDESTLQRVFDPFFTTKAPGEGTGLGLSVVYGIVERHRGAITVYSEVGKGSVFHIYFPASDIPAEPVTQTVAKVSPGNGERILYVDDDESLVDMMKRMLPRLNYRVVGIDDPREALEEFRSDPDAFDLVITDMSMPHLNGPALVRELQAIRPSIPIVMVTGYIRESDMQLAQSLGISALLLKPTTVHEMSEDLHRILSEFRAAHV